MTILYITRKFPPSIGGMQTQSYHLYKTLSLKNEVILISWGGSQLLLPLFLAFAIPSAIIKLLTRKVDVIQLGDLVLSPVGLLLKSISNKLTLTISHGRDSAYSNFIYDLLIVGSAKKLDRIICVSADIKERLIKRGIPQAKLSVIPNGIPAVDFDKKGLGKEESAEIIRSIYGIDLKGKKIIFSATRLVPKKGIKEFVADVFGRIDTPGGNAIYIIAGDGPEKPHIMKVINEKGLKDKVFMTGFVKHGSPEYEALFAVSDVFVMPNVKVRGDSEGFGVVILEAISRNLPVIAYNVDGIGEAIQNGENGILINNTDAAGFAAYISRFLTDENFRKSFIEKAGRYTVNRFSWDRVAGMYQDGYKGLLR